MTERIQSGSYANATKMANDLGPKKTMFILVIVVGCFAVLWPKVFYPMIVGSANQHIKPSPIDRTTGCCDVISEKDVNTIKIMSELCSTIIQKEQDTPLTGREIIAKCSGAILETCGIDISAVLQEKVRLGQTTRQILDQVRSLNGSLCLKYNFGVAPDSLGVPHRIVVKVSPSYSIRQERPIQLRSEMVHPAFRERGSAISQTHTSTPTRSSAPKIMPGRPGPIPAMRPAMGGAGHMVSPSKQSTGTMGLIMPVYTIAIVIFFTYTVMRIMFKKQPESLYPEVAPDPVFRKEVFQSNRGRLSSKAKNEASSKLVVNAMSALLDEVDHEIASRHIADQDLVANGSVPNQEDDQPSVKVLGMETRASCEGGKKWSRSGSPALPTTYPASQEPVEPPQEIYLEGNLPPQSHHLLVSDAATEAQKINSEEDPAVVLAGKMTLSVISLDSSENGTDKMSDSEQKQDERSSSNVSEEFEKIEGEIDEQINYIIDQAQEMALDQKLLDEIKKELSGIGSEKKDVGLTDELSSAEEVKEDKVLQTLFESVQNNEHKELELGFDFGSTKDTPTTQETETISEKHATNQESEKFLVTELESVKPQEVDHVVDVSLNLEENTEVKSADDKEILDSELVTTEASNTVEVPAALVKERLLNDENDTVRDADTISHEAVVDDSSPPSEELSFKKQNEAIADLTGEVRPQARIDPVADTVQVSRSEQEEESGEADDDYEEVEYEYEESDNEDVDEEIINAERLGGTDANPLDRLNGQSQEETKNGITGSSSAEDDLTDDEQLIDDDGEDEEIEEIIEYVTDEDEDEEEEEEAEEVEHTHINNINHLNDNTGATS